MTTNKPEITCWGSFYKGVMQDFGYNEEATKAAAKLDFHGRKISIEPLVRLSDYERLQAECDHYKSAIVEITTRHFTERWVNAASDKELEQYLSDGIAQLEGEYRKQIEALQAEYEKLRSRARAAEREYSKVARTLKGLERVSKVVSDHSDEVCTENNQLRVECKKLRKDADRIDWLADPNNSIGNVQLPMVIVRQHLHSLRDAIDAAMEEENK